VYVHIWATTTARVCQEGGEFLFHEQNKENSMKHLHRVPLVSAFVLLALLLVACSGGSTTATGSSTSSASTPTTASQSPVTLNVFAAASLTESFNDIATQYHTSHPNVTLKYNFNGSQLLAQQIINGAAADVFASADTTNMQKVSNPGLVNNPKIFVQNKLTVVIPTSNPGHITTLKDLAKKGLKIVVAAPSVPVGKYGLQMLDNMGKSSEYGPSYESAVKANFVSQEENVKAVVQKVQLGEADAGIVYHTDVTNAIVNKVKLIDIPDNFNVIARYPIAVTKNSAHAAEAQDFVQYILSAGGQATLEKYRFISVSK
jgi:molybdate transport system substrate-binding protein